MWQCWKFEYLINLDLFYLWDLEVWYVCVVSMLGANGLVNNLGMLRPGQIFNVGFCLDICVYFEICFVLF